MVVVGRGGSGRGVVCMKGGPPGATTPAADRPRALKHIACCPTTPPYIGPTTPVQREHA